MLTPQFTLALEDELIVDLFAGGGGNSTGTEQALGRHVDIAINHDAQAVAMHRMNHPQTEHYCFDVFDVDPTAAVRGRPVGHLHASPDCTHHSQARGGQPRSRAIRSLSWVVHRWAGKVRPRVITLENVEQILQWSPLVAKRCPKTGRTLKVDGSVAAPGERVPVDQQFLVPDRKRRGHNWAHFVAGLRRMGYAVQWKTLVAADYGAPTTRERLYMVARCDGEPIVWPEPTHAKKPGKGRKPWRAAAECIDWSLPCPSIFERARPLAEATMRRIARGVRKYVLDSGDPFILPITHTGSDRVNDVRAPLRTITTSHRGEHALVAPTLVQMGYGERPGQAARALDLQQPLGTVVAGGLKHGLAAVYLAQQNGGFNDLRGTPGRDAREPVSTISSKGSHQQVVAAHLATLRHHSTGTDARDPLSTMTAGGEHHALVECTLSPELESGALRVAAFLMRYYGEGGQHGDLREPAATITTKDRLALVTVTISGTPYVVVDIGLRMLQPRELYSCQGFPATYVIDRGTDADGRTIQLSKSAQVRMCGNSVSPPPMRAIVAANHHPASATERRAA